MRVCPRAASVSICPHFILLSVALPGGRDGSVQSDASSSPSEQSQLGQSHPGYPIGPQVSECRGGEDEWVFIEWVRDVFTQENLDSAASHPALI